MADELKSLSELLSKPEAVKAFIKEIIEETKTFEKAKAELEGVKQSALAISAMAETSKAKSDELAKVLDEKQKALASKEAELSKYSLMLAQKDKLLAQKEADVELKISDSMQSLKMKQELAATKLSEAQELEKKSAALVKEFETKLEKLKALL